MNRKRKLTGLVAAGMTGILLLTAGSCSGENGQSAQEKKAEDQAPLLKKWETDPEQAYPANALGNSLDRKNLVERLKRNNDPNRVSYVYEKSYDGRITGYYVAKGKMTSTEGSLLPTDNIEHPCGYSDCYLTTQGIGQDGTYGPNEGEGTVFFFTAQGVMVTLSATSVWTTSDAPIPAPAGQTYANLTPVKE